MNNDKFLLYGENNKKVHFTLNFRKTAYIDTVLQTITFTNQKGETVINLPEGTSLPNSCEILVEPTDVLSSNSLSIGNPYRSGYGIIVTEFSGCEFWDGWYSYDDTAFPHNQFDYYYDRMSITNFSDNSSIKIVYNSGLI